MKKTFRMNIYEIVLLFVGVLVSALLFFGGKVYADGDEDPKTDVALYQDGRYIETYSNIVDALADAHNNASEIVLYKNMNTEIEIPYSDYDISYNNCDITLNLNGNNVYLNSEYHPVIRNDGKLTIIDRKGGGQVYATGFSQPAIFYVGGDIIFGSDNNPEFNNFTVRSEDGCVFDRQCQIGGCTIFGGTFISKNNDVFSTNHDYPNLKIYGGKFSDDKIDKYIDSDKEIISDGNYYKVVDKKKITNPDGLKWNVNYSKNDEGIVASWDAVEDEKLKEYEVYAAYKNGDTEKTSDKHIITDTSYDFYDFFEEYGGGKYSFYVKALPEDDTVLASDEVCFSLYFEKFSYDLEVTDSQDYNISPANISVGITYNGQEIMKDTLSVSGPDFLVPAGSEFSILTASRPGYIFDDYNYAEDAVENVVKDVDSKSITFTLIKTLDLRIIFHKNDDLVRVNIDIGKGHETLAEKIKVGRFKSESYETTIQGSVISITYKKASYAYDIARIVEQYMELIMHYKKDYGYDYSEETFIDNGDKYYINQVEENGNVHCYPVLALKPLTEFSGVDEINDYLSERKNIATYDNMTFYVLWDKPAGDASFEIDVPQCNKEITIGEKVVDGYNAYVQSYVPNVRKISGAHIRLYSIKDKADGLYSAWINENNPIYLIALYNTKLPNINELLFEGKMTGERTYYAAFSAATDFGYYIKDSKISVNGKLANFAAGKNYTLKICASIDVSHEFNNWTEYNAEKHMRTCSRDGYVEYENHEWGDGEVIEQASETKEGKISYTCLCCETQKTEVIPTTHVKVRFDAKGGTFSDGEETKEIFVKRSDYIKSASVPKASREKYAFLGWVTKEDYDNEKYDEYYELDDESKLLNDDMTLCAVWGQGKVTLLNDGNGSAYIGEDESCVTGSYPTGTELVFHTKPDEDYFFDYWTVEGDDKKYYYDDFKYTVGTEPVSIKAYFIAKENATVGLSIESYDKSLSKGSSGGTYALIGKYSQSEMMYGCANYSMHYGDEVTLKQKADKGYIFDGWYKGFYDNSVSYQSAKPLDLDNPDNLLSKDAEYKIGLVEKYTVIIPVFVKCPNHVWDDEVVTKVATESEDGIELYTCSLCGETKEEIIPRLKPDIPDDEKEVIPYDDSDKKDDKSSDNDSNDKDKNSSDKGTYNKDTSADSKNSNKTNDNKMSESQIDSVITKLKAEKDPAGSEFSPLKLKSNKQTKSSISLSWTKVKGAAKYVVYGAACGKSGNMKKLGTTKTNKAGYKKVAGKKIKKGTYYKFVVVALDKNGNVITVSKLLHVTSKGGKFTNPKSVTVKAKGKKISKVTVKKGKSLKLKTSVIKASKKLKLKKHRKIAFESGNTKIATVNSKGIIKARKKGTCYIFVYAQNGVFKKIKVTVK